MIACHENIDTLLVEKMIIWHQDVTRSEYFILHLDTYRLTNVRRIPGFVILCANPHRNQAHDVIARRSGPI